MKRFLKTFGLLIVGLFLLVSGVDAALDQLSHGPTQNSFTVYSDKGNVVLAYDGDLTCCKAVKPVLPATTSSFHFLHRT